VLVPAAMADNSMALVDDLIVGAMYADPNGDRSGKSYIVFGKANNSAINLSDIANASDPTGGDLPAFDPPFASAYTAPIIKSSKPSPFTSPALEIEKPLRSSTTSPLITKQHQCH
jgi:hypothetical protein